MKSFFEDGVNKKLDTFLSCHDLTQAVATQGGVRTLSNVESVPIKTKLPIKNTRSFTKPQDVFIIQPKVKTSLTSWEGKLKYDHLTGSFSEWQHPLLVSEVTILCFYLHPVDEKLQTARCNLGRARRTF